MSFTQAALSLSGLREWLPGYFALQPSEDLQQLQVTSNPIEFALKANRGDVRLEVHASTFETRFPPLDDHVTTLTLDSGCLLRFSASSAQRLSWFLRECSRTREFFALLLGQPLYPLALGVFPVAARSGYPILFTPSHRPPQDVEDAIDPLVEFEKISSQLTPLFARWYDLYDQLEPVLGLYLGIVFAEAYYLEALFLAVVQALESYHASVAPHKSYLPKKRIDTKAFFPRATHVNSPSLKDRLNELFEKIPESVLCPIMGGPSNLRAHLDKLISSTVKARNALAHGNSVNKPDIGTAVSQLWACLTVLLLEHLGIQDKRLLAHAGLIAERRHLWPRIRTYGSL